MSFEEVNFIKIGAPSLPESALPIGSAPVEYEMKVIRVPVSEKLLNHVCSVSYSVEEVDEEEQYLSPDFIDANVAGFIVISKIDMANRQLHFLAPNNDPLPSKTVILMEGVTFQDTL